MSRRDRQETKLTLKRETVRELEPSLLEQIRGGIDATQNCPTWPVITTVTAPVTQKLHCDLT
ncbi:MAG TPA: hypothetical protein VF137_10545 [Candidatus Dormibacteraeota bacterium]